MIHIIDSETDGLKHNHGHRAFAFAYTDSYEKPQTIYLGKEDLIPLDLLMLCRDNEWVGHNIGFDLPFLADYQLHPTKIHDTMIAAHVYNNLEEHKDLASLALKYCKIENTEDEALETWFKNHGFTKDNRDYSKVPGSIMTPYMIADVTRTQALFKFYKAQGVINDPAYKLEMKLVPIVSHIEATGMRIDLDYAKQEFTRAIGIISDIEDKALREYQVENIGSVQQIAEALFTRGGLSCTIFTEKGNICLDETAIKKYTHPLVDLVLTHREISKLTNTYLRAVIEKSHNGRLHSSLKQVGARTGRFSSSDPNLQNIPRKDERSSINLRKAFIPSEDCSLLLIDLSQIELRILAHYSKEPAMLETLKDRKGDIHQTTAIQMFGDTNDELRTVAKTLNFAVIYGAGGDALVEQLNKALPNKQITLTQAKDFKAKFFKGYPLVQQFLWNVQGRIADRGYVEGKSGRRYYCDKLKAYRASNYLIQGESAMLMKQMMINVIDFLKDKKSQLLNVIHDEAIFDLHNSDQKQIPEILKCFEDLTTWRVPLYANAAISTTSWDEKQKVI